MAVFLSDTLMPYGGSTLRILMFRVGIFLRVEAVVSDILFLP
jgi:hypothetical protein